MTKSVLKLSVFVALVVLGLPPAGAGTPVVQCRGLDATIVGSTGDDNLVGTDGDDVIAGLAGNDVIQGGGGNDVICGDQGRDSLFGQAGDDVIDGGGDDDNIDGGAGLDEIFGGPANDVLLGGDDRDIVRGQGGRDTVRGGAGDDTLYGNDGRDFLYGEAGDDVAYGGQGSDRMYGGDGNDELSGAQGNDLIRGDNGDDLLTGGDDDDRLVGGPGLDSCAGDAGTNILAASCEGDLAFLQLLAFNDYHGHVEASTPGALEGAPAGGGEFLSAKLQELRSGVANSLTVAAGDLIGGSPAFSGLFHDEPSVESLNAMGLDYSGVGNHEFDEGVTELLRMQDGGCHPVDGCYFPEPYAGADFEWLSANVIETATGDTPLPPYAIHDVDGVPVAFIGMTLEATDTLVAASGIVGFEFLDEAATANALVPMLHDQGVDAIVVLLHEGGSQTPPPGDINACAGISGPIVAINNALDPAIDAVVTGHTHLPYNCLLADPAGQPRLVTSAYSFGRVVSELNLVLDRTTNDVLRAFSGATNHAVIQADLVPDPAVTAVIEKWQPLFDAAGNRPVGTITATITRGGTPPGSDRGVESAAGNLVADAQLWATSSNGADVAFMNPGGVRSDLTFPQSGTEGDGVVTFGEAFTFQPFGNTLITYAMTGAEIISVLEEQCQPAGSSRPFLHLGVSEGFTYDLDRTIVAGDCTSVTISNVMLDGAPLDPGATYNVTVNNFLADGGDNFTTLGTIDTPRLDGGNDLTALIGYLGTFSPVAPPSTDRVNE